MATSTISMVACLVAEATAALEVHQHDTALFLAERAVAAAASLTTQTLASVAGDSSSSTMLTADIDTTLLLAKVHLRMNSERAAHHLLSTLVTQTKHPQVRYMHGLCCLKLGLFEEGETRLHDVLHEPMLLENRQLRAACLCLMGQLCMKSGRKVQAIGYFRQCLELNPMMWGAIEGLCQLGEDFKPATFFGELLTTAPDFISNENQPAPTADLMATPIAAGHKRQIRQPDITDEPLGSDQNEPLAVPFTPSPAVPAMGGLLFDAPAAPERPAFGPLQTPVMSATELLGSTASLRAPPLPGGTGVGLAALIDTDTPQQHQQRLQGAPSQLRFSSPSPAPARTTRSSTSSRATGGATSSSSAPGVVPATPSTPSESLRRSTRLSHAVRQTEASRAPPRRTVAGGESIGRSAAAPIATTNAAKGDTKRRGLMISSFPHEPPRSVVKPQGSSQSQHQQVQSKPTSLAGATTTTQHGSEVQGRLHALHFLHQCALVHVHLSQYRCREAIEAIRLLPVPHADSCWALRMRGRALYEMAKYEQAETCFEHAILLEPYRSKGLVDFYSNVLWQLRKDIQLSFLAHQSQERNPKAPETWIAVGNCFSLQKEHDAAVRCFQRSLQLDPDCVIAFTLTGWEYVEHDDFDKAVNCFRNALRIDPRHYSAWYWLGVILNHQEKHNMAEFHFRQAAEINQSSPTVWCHLGMVLGSLQRFDEALEMFHQAEQLDSQNPLVKFRRAKVYISQGLLQNAVTDLEATRGQAPREAMVYRLLADLYRKLDRHADAARAQTIAMDLDPKGTTAVMGMTTDELNDDLQAVATPSTMAPGTAVRQAS